MVLTHPQVLTERTVHLKGSLVAAALLRLAGWRVEFDGLPARQGVIVVYPHTSNWDFVVGILAKWAIGLPLTFWGKDTLFRVPVFGRWLRWIGGVPVDRFQPRGAVGQMVAQLQQARVDGRFQWLALSPEGTRSLTPGWRSGFYRVATELDLPVGLAYLDFGRRRVGVRTYLRFCGDRAQDFSAIARAFEAVRGFKPHLASPVQPRDS